MHYSTGRSVNSQDRPDDFYCVEMQLGPLGEVLTKAFHRSSFSCYLNLIIKRQYFFSVFIWSLLTNFVNVETMVTIFLFCMRYVGLVK